MENFIHEIEVLNQEELKIVNDYIDTLDFFQNTVFDVDGEERADNRVRSSVGSVMNDNHRATLLLHDKLNQSLLIYLNKVLETGAALNCYPIPGGEMTSSHREGIQVLEYGKDNEYKWHFDVCTDPRSDFYHRQISIVLYLSDDFEGGVTKFKFGLECKPKAGTAIFFPSNWCFPHCSTPIVSGKKRVAVTWYFCRDHKLNP